jgi:hypothetical protein
MRTPVKDFENIVEAIDYHYDLERDIKYEFGRTDVYKAIKSHILSSPCYLIEKPQGLDIRRYKGTGPSIHIESLVVPISGDCVSLQISINFNSDPDDPSYYEDSPCDPGIDKTYHIYVPKELVLNYTEEGFQSWLQERKKAQEERKLYYAMEFCKKDVALTKLALEKLEQLQKEKDGHE